VVIDVEDPGAMYLGKPEGLGAEVLCEHCAILCCGYRGVPNMGCEIKAGKRGHTCAFARLATQRHYRADACGEALYSLKGGHGIVACSKTAPKSSGSGAVNRSVAWLSG
jgi:hypothetical protein